MYLDFISTLPDILPFSDQARVQLLQRLKHVAIGRGQLLLREGDICDRLWFIKTGLVRGYQLIDHGIGDFSDITEWFAQENEFFHDPESFANQTPSRENMEVLEPCTLIYIARNDLYDLYNQFPEIRCLSRVIAEHSWFAQKQLMREMRSLSASQRLEAFRTRSKDLFQRVPQKHIASYLGISENYVSKLRAKK